MQFLVEKLGCSQKIVVICNQFKKNRHIHLLKTKAYRTKLLLFKRKIVE